MNSHPFIHPRFTIDPDPNILADLHKALQYKSHVEQHLKEVKSYTDFSSLPSASGPSSNASSSPFVAKSALPFSDPNTPDKAEFIDFSPSTGKSTLHPVPKSSDDGATLDWSGPTTDDDKHEKKMPHGKPNQVSTDFHVLGLEGLEDSSKLNACRQGGLE